MPRRPGWCPTWPGRQGAGLLLQKEIDALTPLLSPERPFVCFLGGAKVSDKLGVLEALIERADTIGVGGAMAYTFLASRGESVGTSLVEPERFDDARRMTARASERGCELMLPDRPCRRRRARRGWLRRHER